MGTKPHRHNEGEPDWCIKSVTELGTSKNSNNFFDKANEPISFLHNNMVYVSSKFDMQNTPESDCSDLRDVLLPYILTLNNALQEMYDY